MAYISPPSGHVQELAAEIERVALAPRSEDLQALLEPADEWAISADVAQLLAGLVTHSRPKSVLEFGAGRSSLVLASAIQAIGGGRLTSIEHQPTFAEPAWRLMARYAAVDALLVHAGLALKLSRHGLLYEYTRITRPLQERGAFDLVFIDAPPGHLGRDATLLAAAPFLAAGALVVLDDAKRPYEQSAVRRWENALEVERVFESESLGRGVVVLRIGRPAVPSFSVGTFVGTIRDRLVEWRFSR